MSMLNGVADLDRDFRGGNNRNNQNNRNDNRNNRNDRRDNRDRDNRNNRDDRRNRSREYQGIDNYSFGRSSYMTDDARAELENDNGNREQRRDRRAEEIFDFLDEFKSSAEDFRALKDLVVDKFPSVVRHCKSYYSQKNSDQFNNAINKLINIVSTSNFANVLNNILEHGDWLDDGSYDKMWRDLAFTLATALEIAHNKMHGSVIKMYAATILPRMWKPEIGDIVKSTGVTRDLALDLIIAIPMVDADWNSGSINEFYPRFLDKMIIHAEDNMDVLNWEVQGVLYKTFFGDSKTALRVIGKYLVSEPKDSLTGEVELAVYNDFRKMLYSKLDLYDIKDIAYVFDYVAKYRKQNPNAKVTYDAKEASAWENVKKGLFQTMDQDADNMTYLA